MRPRFSVRCDWRLPEPAEPWTVHWCGACHYGAVRPSPEPEEVAGFYPEDYYTHEVDHAANQARSFGSRLRQHLAWRTSHEAGDTPAFLRGFLPEATHIRVLDLGCGNGVALAPFRAAGMEVIGVEPDDRARAVVAAQLDAVYPGTAEAPPDSLEEASFDCVRVCHALEHCVDPGRALDRAIRFLRPGGVLMLETPNSDALGFEQQLGAWPWTDIPRHLHFFSARSLQRACEQRGLTVETCDYRGFGRQLTDGWLAAEQRIHAVLHPDAAPPRVGVRAWRLLLRSFFASRARKYDSVYLIARRP